MISAEYSHVSYTHKLILESPVDMFLCVFFQLYHTASEGTVSCLMCTTHRFMCVGINKKWCNDYFLMFFFTVFSLAINVFLILNQNMTFDLFVYGSTKNQTSPRSNSRCLVLKDIDKSWIKKFLRNLVNFYMKFPVKMIFRWKLGLFTIVFHAWNGNFTCKGA